MGSQGIKCAACACEGSGFRTRDLRDAKRASGRAQAAAVFLSAILMPAMSSALDSTKIGTAALIAPSSAETYYPASTTSTNSIGTTAPPNEIVELAAALNNNVDEIYDFVRNNVDTVFIFGAQKGPLGAIVDKSGTPFDQAQLMVSLLRAANPQYTAKYQFGTITLTGAQFQAWTNITNAQAACNLLASGGIPANINGSSATFNCTSLSTNATVSLVQLDHVWVTVTIGGTDYQFDPSYKPYNFKTGVNLASAASLSAGQALAAANAGEVLGTTGAVGYVQTLNATSLNSQLKTYADGIQSYIQAQSSPAQVALASGQIKDLVGGGDIQRYDPPLGQSGQRITALPYAAVQTRTWTDGIPDAFRTTLRVQLTYNLAGTYTQIIDKTLFADEIYGRKLNFQTNFNANQFQGSLVLADEFGATNTLASYTANQSLIYSSGSVTLTVNHPYAADATGTGTGGTYMDISVVKPVIYVTPFTIVHGWGDANRGLIDKWSSRPDSSLPDMPPQGCDSASCAPIYNASAGDARREQYAANWLVQASKAARLHAAIAKSIYTHHHTIGIVAGDSVVRSFQTSAPGDPLTYGYALGDNLDVIDVETGFSVTSVSADAVARRAAIHAIAATEAALEGSVISQTADLPDSVSVARRFEWANTQPSGEDPSGAGPRKFYEFNSSNGSNSTTQVLPLMVVEGAALTTSDGIHGGGEPVLGQLEYQGREQSNATAISRYAAAGFTVIAPGESFLGPGQRGGQYIAASTGTWSHLPSMQRGGAMVATRYDSNGVDPLEIAHAAINDAGRLTIKGGGGGVQPNQESIYDPATAADVLKSRFVDRSTEEGVDLRTGAVTYTSPASITVGNGGFPYELSANLIWRGGNTSATSAFGPRSDVEPQTPWTTNWNNSLSLSGSGIEAMGETDIRASAGTVAAFLAMQDIYKAPVSRQREVSAVLVAAWWVRQLTGNVASVNLGADTRQYFKRYDGNWFTPGAGPFASLKQTGTRTVYTEPSCGSGGPSYVLTRGFNDSAVSFTVTNAHAQSFPYWTNVFRPGDGSCARLHGFRLGSWSFPQGMTVNLVYQPTGYGGVDRLAEVNNSIGRKIEFIAGGFFPGGVGGFNNGLTGADLHSVSIDNSNPVQTIVTDATQAVTKVYQEVSGGRYLIDQIFEANNSSTTPSEQYSYDTLRRPSQFQDARLQSWRFRFGEGVRGDRVDPAGGIYTVFFDTYRRPMGLMDELDRTTAVQADGRGRIFNYTYPEGDQETLAFDDNNNVTQLTKMSKLGSGQGQFVAASAAWDQTWNKPLWIRDALNNQTDFTYYPSGVAGASLLWTATRPSPDGVAARPVYTFTYSPIGRLGTRTDPTNLVVSNSYDPSNGNLLTSALDPTGANAVIGYAYDPNGNFQFVTDPRLYVTENQYDQNRRKTVVLHHNGNSSAGLVAAERTIYDILGRVKMQEGGTAFSGVTVSTWQTLESKTYTPTSKVQTEQNGAGNTTTYFYDAVDRLLMVQDPANRIVATVYDAAGETLCTWRGWSSTSSAPNTCAWNPSSYAGAGPVRYGAYTYNLNGTLATILDANNNLTTNTYDGFDRLFTLNFPVSTKGARQSSTTDYEQYTYDNNGNRTMLRLRDAQTIVYTYDNLNRAKVKQLPGATSGWQYFGYDAAGRPSYAHFGSATGSGVDYGYDSARRLTSETTFGRTLQFLPDAAGNRIQLTYPDGNFINYDVDGLNRIWRVRENNATSGAGVLATYTYDPLSRKQSVAWGNGTASSFGYDLASRLNGLRQDLAGTTQDLSLGFIYTPASYRLVRAPIAALIGASPRSRAPTCRTGSTDMPP